MLRDGRAVAIPTGDVVSGDVLVLEAGDLVGADARLLEANVLTTNEAPLTGENKPVDENTEPSTSDAPLGERSHMVRFHHRS